LSAASNRAPATTVGAFPSRDNLQAAGPRPAASPPSRCRAPSPDSALSRLGRQRWTRTRDQPSRRGGKPSYGSFLLDPSSR